MTRLYGGIEAGGTKTICAIANENGQIIREERFTTGDCATTLFGQIVAFFGTPAEHGASAIAAIGIGSFGPLVLNAEHADYGRITVTTKMGWGGASLLQPLRPLGVALALDSDVNCAAIAEHLFGNGTGVPRICYVTVGTGIGAGMMIDGGVFGGSSHLELGHILVPRVRGDEEFSGVCSFHADCVEGLASGPAIQKRWGKAAEALPADHPAWNLEADYVAILCANISYSLRPDRIILGGGVMTFPGLIERVRKALPVWLARYDGDACGRDPENYIMPAGCGPKAGLHGALALGYRHVEGRWPTHWTAGD